MFPLPPPFTYNYEVLVCPNYDTLLTEFRGPLDMLKQVQSNMCDECGGFSFSFSLWLNKNRIIHVCRTCINVCANNPNMFPALYPANSTSYDAKYQFALSLYKFYRVYETQNYKIPAYQKALEDAHNLFNSYIARK